MIKLSNLNKIYPDKFGDLHALKNINLHVAPGEIVGVIGKSGAGKSTLIRCVNLLERPTSGSVRVNNIELTTLNPAQLREARHQIGMVFQHFNLLETRTVYENVAFPLQLLKKSTEEIDHAVMALLEKVGLDARRNYYPNQLSGGQKQRVAIARALATKPRVLLCDEMTSSLDPETTDDILQLIRDINREMRLSILCITHEMHVIKTIADRVAVIDHSEIVECEKLVDLFKNPKTPVAKKFVQSVFKSELPDELQSKLHDEAMPDDLIVLRLTFFGHATVEPIMNEFMQQTHVKVNILQAMIEQLRSEMIGRMIIALDVEKAKLEKVKAFLEKDGLTVEVMGYVDRQAWAN
ncbi:MAG: ATP-binding cassette domain-containing protein [Gammaproteobacteria bacterium]|nr:ATP-binding cassette domain-containing protein [Gammaproteobacteria bacterium]